MNISIDTYRVGTLLLRDNHAILAEEEVKILSGWLRSRALNKLASCGSNSAFIINSKARIRFFLQMEALFKKDASFADEEITSAAAISAFERGERICRIANRRLDYYYVQRSRIDQDLDGVITRAEAFISSCLGEFRPFLESLPKLLRVTSGASATLPRRKALPPLKLNREVEAYPRTYPYLDAMSNLMGYRLRVKVRTCNRVEFVAKNWKTKRGIACEASGSLPFQLAFDAYAKDKLRLFGVDLADQSRNQDHARKGSIDGSLATIDLSMASDTLSFNTVAWLLPTDWFNYLNDHRAPQYSLNGGVGTYAKFSSMGNGATFALETLIFLALVRACGCKEGVVYGDDITIGTSYAPLLLKALRFFGFVPNVEKSYFEGPFRESCGGNYYNGTDVTPFYVRISEGLTAPELVHNINGLRAISEYGAVWDYLGELTLKYNPLIVPVNADSLTGIHVHPHFAHGLKLLKSCNYRNNARVAPSRRYVGISGFKGYQAKSDSLRIEDHRTLFLWYLRASQRGNPLPGAPYSSLEASGYTVSSKKYRRKWMVWNYLPEGTDPGLWAWSSFISQVCQIEVSG